jgi:hypothetical protein
MKKGDVVTVLTVSGEYVGKFKSQTENTVEITDPRMLVQTQEGMGFAAGVCVTGKRDVNEIVFNQFIFMTETNEEIEKAYRQATSGIVMA